jgi:hypothetical protein
MPERAAIFRLSEQGLQVRCSRTSRLPQRYQRLLQAIDGLTPFDVIAACLPLESRARVAQYLEDLEAIGLVESVTLEWLAELHLVDAFPQTKA